MDLNLNSNCASELQLERRWKNRGGRQGQRGWPARQFGGIEEVNQAAKSQKIKRNKLKSK